MGPLLGLQASPIADGCRTSETGTFVRRTVSTGDISPIYREPTVDLLRVRDTSPLIRSAPGLVRVDEAPEFSPRYLRDGEVP